MLLNIVEMAKSHSGANLAAAFAKILNAFGISEKVSNTDICMKKQVFTRVRKVLSITCDNTLCNNTMIEELANLVPTFPGKVNQTCCFLHIINLVVKSVIQQFDVEKGKADDALDEAELELCGLAEGIDLEDLETQGD
jgi:hypothetical protein